VVELLRGHKAHSQDQEEKSGCDFDFSLGKFHLCDLIRYGILLRLLDQDEQKKPGRYERVSTTATIQRMNWSVVFLRAAQSPGRWLSRAAAYHRQN
jgi:hypothetical protein